MKNESKQVLVEDGQQEPWVFITSRSYPHRPPRNLSGLNIRSLPQRGKKFGREKSRNHYVEPNIEEKV